MDYEPRDFLIYFSVKYKGDWNKIYEALCKKEQVELEDVRLAISSLRTKTITILDEEYPLQLKQIYQPPFVLYYKGDISLLKDFQKNLAVVGSREPSNYAITHLNRLIKGVAKDLTIISGCAIGVDALAHETAIKNGGRTIGVLGSGIDVYYPKTNSALIEEIAAKHLLISEYPEGVEPSPSNFTTRNRIVVGLSTSVMVFDMKAQSGTQSTANKTIASNRNLLTIPYPLGTEYMNNSLIKDGCFLIEEPEDIKFLHENF